MCCISDGEGKARARLRILVSMNELSGMVTRAGEVWFQGHSSPEVVGLMPRLGHMVCLCVPVCLSCTCARSWVQSEGFRRACTSGMWDADGV